MSEERLEPLEPELVALLDTERGAAAPDAALDRVWSRVAVVALPSPPGAGAHAGAAASRGWLASHAAGVAAATFVLGGLAGAGIHAIVQKPPAERIVYADRVVPGVPAVPAPPVVAPVPSAVPTVDTSPTPRASSHAPAPSATSSLAAERALLDDARGALGAGDAGKALALADEHGRRFPRAQLGEEREAIAIQALVALGRNDEARARAARFRAVAPNSLFMPAIDAALQSIP
jgi:hypothetical protein